MTVDLDQDAQCEDENGVGGAASRPTRMRDMASAATLRATLPVPRQQRKLYLILHMPVLCAAKLAGRLVVACVSVGSSEDTCCIQITSQDRAMNAFAFMPMRFVAYVGLPGTAV